MLALMHDFRIALRQLRKAPGFAVTVILTFALGIGATTAIFSLVEGVLLMPLSFRNPEQLVLLGDRLGDGVQLSVAAPEVATYSHFAQTYSSIGAYSATSWELSGGPLSQSVNGARLTAAVFPTLGIAPALGRVFTQQEDDAHIPVAVISYALWVSRFHRDPHVIGGFITLNRKSYNIVGVMPRSFEFPLIPGHIGQAQLWVPMSFTAEELSPAAAGIWGTHLVARIRTGVTIKQAAEDANRVAQQVMRDFPPEMAAIRIRGDAIPLGESILADVRPMLRTLFVAVCIVLLIACANAATMMLVRSMRRRREHAVRLAIGASARTVLRQCVSEGVLLSLAGGTLGLAFAAIALHVAIPLLPESMPRIDAIAINPAVALFTLLVAIVTGVLCSLAPASAAVRINLTEGLKEDARSGAGSVRQSWFRSFLVIGEIAVATILLTASLAFLRSYQKMLAVDPGFRPDHLLIAGYLLPTEQYASASSIANFNREVVARLAAQPGTVAAGLGNTMPDTGGGGRGGFTIEGASVAEWKLRFAPFTQTYGDYFRALGIPVIAGRTFTVRDNSDSPLVCIVDESMAKQEWPGQNPIGKRLHLGTPKRNLPWATVIGVVSDVRIDAPDRPAGEQWYFPLEQPAIIERSSSSSLANFSDGWIALRSTLPSDQMVQTLRAVVAGIDPRLALDPVQPMADAISAVEAPRRFNTSLISAFALAAVFLSAMGVYAVSASSVSQRTEEIAIRMALGAQRGNIARLVLSYGAKIAVIGSTLGILGSLCVSRLVDTFLFGVSATNPIVFAMSAALMVLLALVATARPALRAASADPARVLHSA
jgi:predicted permease